MTTTWMQSRYGGPEVLEAQVVSLPAPGRGQVRIEIAACSLNSADVRIMRGEPLLLRLVFGLRRPKSAVPGRDVAGTVVAVGDGAGLSVGDRVVGELPGGGLGPAVCAAASAVTRIPDDVAWDTAAALPLAGGTAWQALDLAGVTAGSRVLVVGAGGGVGTLTVSLARVRGARVDAVGGARSEAVLRGLGAETVTDHRADDLSSWEPGVYDAVIDIAGTTPLRRLRRLVRPGGSVILVAGGTNRVLGPLPRMLAAAVLGIGSRRRLRPLAATTRVDLMAELLALAADGRLRPHIERRWRPDDARDAMAHLDSGHAVGKNVIVS